MKLPEWIEKYMEPEKPFEGSWVKYDGENYVLTTPLIEKWPDIKFDNIYDAYAHGRKTRGSKIYVHWTCPEVNSIDVDNSNYLRIKSEFKGPVPPQKNSFFEVERSPRFLLMTDRCHFESYFDSAKSREDYFLEVHDFESAYSYVTWHPVFWVRDPREKYTGPFGWNKDSSQAVWSMPMWTNNSYKWALETGSHIPDSGYAGRYHDLRLDVYGDTIEEAYVMLADEVFKLWEFDGTEKEGNVDH